MAKKYRVAIIGMDHIHAAQLFGQFNQYAGDRIEWVGYADTTDCSKELLAFKEKLNFKFREQHPITFYESWQELLEQNLDIALVCSDIQSHGWICEETLKRGIHTVVEKPMATTLEDGMRMYRAAKRSTAKLVINWPVAWFESFNKAKELADSGVIGQVLRFQYRSPSTRGPYKLGQYTNEELSQLFWYDEERGGGSIMDYAGYGCALSTWFMNQELPVKVSGVKKNFFLPFSDVPDYSTFTMDYENAVSIIEGSWSTMNNGEIATGPVLYGTEGVIVADRFNKELKVYKDFKPYVPSQKPTEVFVVGDDVNNISINLMDHLEKGTPLHEMVTVDFNIRAMAVLDAGRRSCDSGNSEYVRKIW